MITNTSEQNIESLEIDIEKNLIKYLNTVHDSAYEYEICNLSNEFTNECVLFKYKNDENFNEYKYLHTIKYLSKLYGTDNIFYLKTLYDTKFGLIFKSSTPLPESIPFSECEMIGVLKRSHPDEYNTYTFSSGCNFIGELKFESADSTQDVYLKFDDNLPMLNLTKSNIFDNILLDLQSMGFTRVCITNVKSLEYKIYSHIINEFTICETVKSEKNIEPVDTNHNFPFTYDNGFSSRNYQTIVSISNLKYTIFDNTKPVILYEQNKSYSKCCGEQYCNFDPNADRIVTKTFRNKMFKDVEFMIDPNKHYYITNITNTIKYNTKYIEKSTTSNIYCNKNKLFTGKVPFYNNDIDIFYLSYNDNICKVIVNKLSEFNTDTKGVRFR